jgi:hypothetical protein
MDKKEKTMSKAMSKNIRWIARTAVFLALAVALQLATAQVGAGLVQQFLTGSVVNLMLIVSTVTCGIATGATVACIAPVYIKLIGLGSEWPLVPFIVVGNIVLVIVWFIADKFADRFAGKVKKAKLAEKAQKKKKSDMQDGQDKPKKPTPAILAHVAALPIAALFKTGTLYAGIVLIAIPVLLPELEPGKVAAFTLAYSWPQLVTASIGGAVAIVVLPVLKKALKTRGGD